MFVQVFRAAAATLLIVAASAAIAQQSPPSPPSPEMQAVQQMYAQSQQQEFALRVEVAKLRAENEKLKAAQVKPDTPAKP